MKRKYVQAMMAGTAFMLSLAMPADSVFAAVPEKDQTVYVNADESGNAQKVIVSNWLKNIDKASSLTDKSSLSDIQNVKGDETFTKSSDGTLTWNTDGSDIYYQGETNENLPVSVKMTYYLDGKEILPSELAGKSGKVKIRINYENNAKQTTKIGGKDETIYTPFMMATGMILPADTFSNVEVTNGKIISDGNNDIVVGVGFPGLADSLQLDSIEGVSADDIPDYVEISADVNDFSLALTATVATTGTLKELGFDDIDSLDELQDSMDKLSDSSEALVDGSKELQEGLETLDSSVDTLADGLESADAGAGKLKNGIDTMNSKKADLMSGISQLLAGMNSLGSGASDLQTGVKTYTDGVNQLYDVARSVDDGTAKLKGGIDELNSKKGELVKGISDLYDGAKSLSKGSSTLQEKLKEYTDGADSISENLGLLYGGMQKQFAGLTGASEKITELGTGIGKLSGAADSFSEGAEKVEESAAAISTALTGLNQAVSGAKASVDSAVGAISSVDTTDAAAVNAEANTQATRQAQAAVSEKLGAANAQQTANVQAALNAAGVDADTQAKIMQNLGGISADASDVSISVDVSGKINTNNDAASTLAAAQNALSGISKQLASAGFDTGKIDELKNGAAAAQAGAAQMKTELQSVTGTLSGMSDINESLQALLGNVKALYDGSVKLVGKDKANSLALNGGMAAAAKGVSDLQSGIGTLAKGAGTLSSGIQRLSDGAASLSYGTTRLKSGANQLAANSLKLNAGTAQLKSGTNQLITGGGTLASGAGALSVGIQQLADGASELKDGTGKLADGGKELKDGTTKLSDGGKELADGMNKFDEEGIQKLTSMMDGDLQNVLDRLKAVTDADKEYTAFDGWDKDIDGNVKFIIETSSIQS